MDTPDNPQLDLVPGRDIYSVARLNREVRARLESGFGAVWVEGELSNVSTPRSGHIYFTLKDDRAQVRCAMFSSRKRTLGFRPANGTQVLVNARLSVYEPRGDYQLIVESMEEAGEGALRRAFEQLKKKLAAEGLFAAENKQPLPAVPLRIGIITSPTGAALRDVLKVLRRRFPAIPVLVYPVSVQGAKAPGEIVAAIRLAQERAECDVLLLTRGGGSLEDLQAFNEEAVVRAVAECDIPVICGVGHEIDFSIADFAADQRAPTPSAAAEMLVPDRHEWLRGLVTTANRLVNSVRQAVGQAHQKLVYETRRLDQQHPGQRLRQQTQRLDELEQRLATHMRHRVESLRGRLAQAQTHLQRVSPRHRLARTGDALQGTQQRLAAATRATIDGFNRRLSVAARALDAVSPLATLDRGYAIVTAGNKIVRDATRLKQGDAIEARVARGIIEATVTGTRKEKE
ncbi:MAG: exodeoxyribonuclease VII large subunit [Gammaproteobacteria bacterium]|nr:exodeoxyribonuclease VII large subunit [Gammaproteobacteria bacterium]NNF61461.1 exodeoxyribonuclease VII large subunit [Gammaproteobacteria bacterium]NNM21173.1 exodeoxyribonuclease VII large subunit [Gammaproteobacteria bacterium]